MNRAMQSANQKKIKEWLDHPPFFAALQGGDRYSIQAIIKRLQERAQEGNGLIERYNGKEKTLHEVLTQAQVHPIFHTHKLILIQEAEGLSIKTQKEALQRFAHYLQSPPSHSSLIFIYSKILSPRTPLYRLLKEANLLYTFEKIKEKEVPQWITRQLQMKGFTIEPKAALLLPLLLGNDLSLISQELRKILLYLGGEKRITFATVAHQVGMRRELTPFALQDALLERQPQKAYEIAYYFAQNKKKYPLLPILAMLTKLFSTLLQIVHLQKKGVLKREELAQALSLHPYFIKSYLQATRSYTTSTLIKNIHLLHEADLQLKGIKAKIQAEGEILKQLTLQLLIT